MRLDRYRKASLHRNMPERAGYLGQAAKFYIKDVLQVGDQSSQCRAALNGSPSTEQHRGTENALERSNQIQCQGEGIMRLRETLIHLFGIASQGEEIRSNRGQTERPARQHLVTLLLET